MLRREGVSDRHPAPERHQMRKLDALLMRLQVSDCFSQMLSLFTLTGKGVMNRVVLLMPVLIYHHHFIDSCLFIL